ncbi:dual OB domain-containing protein [Bradyrhizobium oligotrophicum]|uniref:dual OB domain-containing protein n=1 Tax=Bradyrhizobium oligotrophicum TaxID=44255 RepID=UPI003EB88D22
MMSLHNLIITDVTRYGNLFCVAGWDLQNGRMIRPEPPAMDPASEPTRFWGNGDAGPGRFFDVGNVVRFQAKPAPAGSAFPHATEDVIFVKDGEATVVRKMTLAEIANSVASGVAASIDGAFGGTLQRAASGKAYVPAGAQTVSLDALEIEPASISFYEDINSAGKRKLRAQIIQDGIDYDLSIPADSVLAQFSAGGLAALNASAQGSERIHVRLGLSRPFREMPNSCYAQVNGLYFL